MKLSITQLEIPFKQAFVHATAIRSCTESILVKAESSRMVGVGEGCPRDYVTGETILTATNFFDTHRDEWEQFKGLEDLQEWVASNRERIPMTLVFAVMNWTYLSAMVLCEPTLAIWLQYTAPAWVFLISWICFKEHPTYRDGLLLLFASLGVAVILQAELWGASPAGVRYGLASGLFFALVIVTLKWNHRLDAAWLIFLNHAVTGVVLAPVLFQQGVYPTGQQWIYLMGFGFFQIGLPYMLFVRGLRIISSHEASGLTLLEPLLVPVWVYVAWRNTAGYEFPATTTLIGGGLILAGLLLRYFGSRSQEETQSDKID